MVAKVEECALLCASASSDNPTKRKCDYAKLQKRVKECLPNVEDFGVQWLSILLASSKKLYWTGGQIVYVQPPTLAHSVKDLAESTIGAFALSTALREQAASLQKTPPATDTSAVQRTPRPAVPVCEHHTLRVSSESSTQEIVGAEPRAAPQRNSRPQFIGIAGVSLLSLGDQRHSSGAKMSSGNELHVGGIYRVTGTHHDRNYYVSSGQYQDGQQRVLYYWDDRDGDEHRGWYIAPEIGSDEMW
eukprot:5299438-Amphidinium_carterae.1